MRLLPPHLGRVVSFLIKRFCCESAETSGSRFREIERLGSLPRYTEAATDLLGRPIKLIDAASFLSAYHEIFEREIYRFSPSRVDPRIIDCGANIGLATIYWKQLHPEARITAFEPDPRAFAALLANCEEWQLTSVQLVNKAVWYESSQLDFWAQGADGGHVVDDTLSRKGSTIRVPAVRLRDYLSEDVDLLKLDIEGAEVPVLLDCADSLDRVARVFVEFHSFIGREQRIDELLSTLRAAGFRIHIQPELVSPQPFVKRLNSNEKDQRLNIFGYRDSHLGK